MTNNIKLKQIAPGLEGCFIPTDRFNTARVSLTFYLPMNEKTAAGYALLPNLLSGASAEYPDSRSLSMKMDRLYNASLSATADKLGDLQVIRMGITCIENRFAIDGSDLFYECANLLRGVIFRPLIDEGGFDEKLFEREKRMFIESIDGEINDKGKYAVHKCEEILCKGEPYGLPLYGSRESAAAITRSQAYDLWKRVLSEAYIRTNITARENNEKIFDMFIGELAKIKRSNVVMPKTATSAARETVTVQEERMSITQGKLCMGFRTEMSGGDRDSYPLMIMADMFGGGTYSRLFSVVREKMSLCYYCSARANRRKGVILVSSGVEFENLEKVRSEVLNQLEVIKRGEFTNDDLDASKLSLCDSLNSITDSQGGIERWYTDRADDKDVVSPDELCSLLSSVTREQVIAAANGVQLDTVYMLKGNEVE